MEKIRLGELCAATSLFTDLGTGQPVEHGLRSCLVSMRLAHALGLDVATKRETFFVSLLRFLGCTADSYLAAELFNGDDVGFLSKMAPVAMGSPREELVGLFQAATGSAGFPGGLRALFGAFADRTGKDQLLEAHCEVGSRLATDMGLPPNVSGALAVAYARWDGKGVPRGVGGEDIPISIRVSLVARDLELWSRDFGPERAAETLRKRSERAYDPTVAAACLSFGIDQLRRSDDDLWETVVGMEPDPWAIVAGSEAIGRALGALGDFADLKAPEFGGHSRSVRRIVEAAGERARLSRAESEILGMAASVHDVGMVAAPARVWRRADRSPAEVEQAQAHPMWSQRLLSRVGGLGEVAVLAGRHHERNDGSGYPAGLEGDLGRSVGLLACAELYEERMRHGWSLDRVAEEITRLGGAGGLAAGDVRCVLDAVGVAMPLVEVERPAGLTEREVDVLRLLATGHTNRQIAARLGITIRTVGSHVEHIYAKAQVRTRAAATLFAAKHDLVG